MAKDAGSFGPEFCGLHSCKVQVKGQRRVLCAEFSALVVNVKGTIGVGGTLALGKIVDTLAGANSQMLQAMIVAGVNIYEAVVEECEALVMP